MTQRNDIPNLPRAPADQHPVRPAGPWAIDKLGVLNAYLWTFSKACNGAQRGYRPYEWWYVDAMAGPGVNVLDDGHRFPGSPLIASSIGAGQAYPPAAGLALADERIENVRALRQRLSDDGRANIFRADVNRDPEAVLAPVPRTAPTIAFFDPEGFDVAWSTLGSFARWKRPGLTKVELLVMLPTHVGMLRTLFLEQNQPEWAEEKWDRLFGPLDWRAVYQARRSGELTASQAPVELVDLFRQGMTEDLGYQYTLRRRVPATDTVRYWLLFATDSPAGERIMDHAMRRVFYGQEVLPFFGTDDLDYR